MVVLAEAGGKCQSFTPSPNPSSQTPHRIDSVTKVPSLEHFSHSSLSHLAILLSSSIPLCIDKSDRLEQSSQLAGRP